MTGALVAAGATCALTYVYMLAREIIRWPRKDRIVSPAWIALAFAGWIAAALAVGLLLGERGRRIDAYREMGRRGPSSPAVIRSSPNLEERAAVEIERAERSAIKNGIREAARAEGRKITKSQLEADVDQIMDQISMASTGL